MNKFINGGSAAFLLVAFLYLGYWGYNMKILNKVFFLLCLTWAAVAPAKTGVADLIALFPANVQPPVGFNRGETRIFMQIPPQVLRTLAEVRGGAAEPLPVEGLLQRTVREAFATSSLRAYSEQCDLLVMVDYVFDPRGLPDGDSLVFFGTFILRTPQQVGEIPFFIEKFWPKNRITGRVNAPVVVVHLQDQATLRIERHHQTLRSEARERRRQRVNICSRPIF